MTDNAIPKTCDYCGMIHLFTTCPRIRAIEYHENGAIKRVEFHEPRVTATGDPNAPLAYMK